MVRHRAGVRALCGVLLCCRAGQWNACRRTRKPRPALWSGAYWQEYVTAVILPVGSHAGAYASRY